MRSIVAVTLAAEPAATQLTTLARFKAELGITGTDSDTAIGLKIDQVSSAIQTYLGFTLAREGVTETFRPSTRDRNQLTHDGALVLDRTPVATISSVTVDGQALSAEDYELDAEPGLLYRLDGDGYPCPWRFSKAIVVAYAGGYVLPPGSDSADLNPAIETAALSLLRGLWFARTRDPLLKSENILEGLYSYTLFSPGEEGGGMPPDVAALLAPLRRPLTP